MSAENADFKDADDCFVVDIRLVSIKADALKYEIPHEGVRVQFELGQFQGRKIEEGVRVRARAETTFFADGDLDRVLSEIELWYEVDLSIPEGQAEAAIHDADRKSEIIESYVAPALFPFVRQKIHELTNELPLLPVLLPVDTLR